MKIRSMYQPGILAAGFLALSLSSLSARDAGFGFGFNTNAVYAQSNLVSDVSGNAPHTDARLLNPWGILAIPEGVWVNLNHSGLTAGYGSQGSFTKVAIQIPSPSGGGGGPPGVVFHESA